MQLPVPRRWRLSWRADPDIAQHRSRVRAEQQIVQLMQSLDTRLKQSLREESGPPPAESGTRTVSEAVERFLQSYGVIESSGRACGEIEYGTFRKYRNSLGLLTSFAAGRGINLSDLTLESLEAFRRTREIRPVTWKVELQTLRTFFSYCVKHK